MSQAFLAYVRDHYHLAVRDHCEEPHCTFDLRGFDAHVILKGEELVQGERASDYVIFVQAERDIVMVLEMKGRTMDASEVREKLLNSTRVAIEIAGHYPQARIDLDLIHLVLSRRIDASEYRSIVGRPLAAGGRKFSILAKRCGTSLYDILWIS